MATQACGKVPDARLVEGDAVEAAVSMIGGFEGGRGHKERGREFRTGASGGTAAIR